MKRQGFRHIGEVVALERGGEKGSDRGVVSVSFNRTAACDGCHAKGHCTVSVEGEMDGARVMSVETPLAETLEIGDKVEVSITYRVGAIAVVMAYILPLVVFISTLIVSIAMGLDQGLSAGVAFVVAALYYCGVYICRDRFEKIVNFEVNRL